MHALVDLCADWKPSIGLNDLGARHRRLYLVATSNERAKSFLRSNVQFDLVVSAVVLKDGGESGVDLAEHIEDSGRSSPTLLVSHFSRDLLRFVPGFETQGHFLVNPFTAPELLSRVGSSLLRQR